MTTSTNRGPTNDPYDLARFLRAQEPDYEQALAELKAGQKRTHRMWYIFPQILGLGGSPMSQRYAIKSWREAAAYLEHPILGPRLVECAEALLGIEGRSASAVLGYPDDLKLRSCATLFAAVSSPGSVFEQLLAKYYGNEPDSETLRLLKVNSGVTPPSGP